MGNYENLKQSITEVIRTNGNKEITGAVLQSTLLTIISTVGANATFAGIATPTTNPGTPDGSVFWLASESGTYSNFGSVELQDGLSVLTWNGSWSSQQIFGVDDIPTIGSNNIPESNGVFTSIANLAVGLEGTAQTGNMHDQIVSHMMLDKDGNIVSGLRSLLKVSIVSTCSKVTIYGLAIARYAFFANEPNMSGDSQTPLSVVTSNIQPTTIPTGAKWIVYDISETYTPAENVYAIYENQLSKRVLDSLPSANLDDIRTDGLYRTTLSNGSPAILLVSENGTFQTRFYEYGHKQIIGYRKYSEGSWGNYRNYDNTITSEEADSILPDGIYNYVVATTSISVLLFVNNQGTRQMRIYRILDGTVKIDIREYSNNQWGKWSDYLGNKATNPILKNHTNQEIFWRGTARLFWDSAAKKVYWSDGNTGDSSNVMLNLNFNDVTVKLSNTVKEKVFSTSGNAQLLLPLGGTTVYSLDDIVVQAGTTYNQNEYVKLAHIAFGNAISSFVILDYHLDADRGIDIANESLLTSFSLDPNTNYHGQVIIGGNIGSDGILSTYNGRGAFFFKLPQAGVAPIISGCSILAYQWYSGYPDYKYGSNSLGRTMTNTPPSGAVYGGLTINLSNDYSNITIKAQSSDVDDNKEVLSQYGSAVNNSIGENCFANGLRTNLKILAYGNSFMRNSVHYLSAIAKNGCNVNLTVGNLYTGGTELQDHYEALLNNTNSYEWHKYVDGVNTINQTSQTAMRGLLDERWDAIIVHQYIPWQYPFEPTLNRFLKLIVERLGYTPKIYINSTWAGSLDNNETYYGYDTEEKMWEAMLNYVKQACEDAGIQEYSILPTGTAIQNARTLSYANSYNRFVNSGTDWHHLNPAGGFIAACTIYEKIIAKLNGVHCSNTTFRITSATALPPSSDVQQGILVTDDNYMSMCQATIEAVNNPNVITTIIESE